MKSISIQNLLIGFVLLTISITLVSPLLVSRILPDGSMLINGSGDNLWHLSLASEITKQFPPSFPGISGVMLKNYHYFSDAIWGLLSAITKFPLTTIYFQVGSLLVSLALIFVLYSLGRRLTNSRFWSVGLVLTTLFIGSASFVKPLLLAGSNWQGNTFMLDTPYDQMINLHTGIGYILVISSILSFYIYSKSKNTKHLYCSAITIAVLTGFKSFFAIPLIFAFGLVVLLNFWENPKNSILASFLIVSISGFIFFSISDRTAIGNTPLEFRPFWILTKMIEDPDRLPMPNLYLKYLHYLDKANFLRVAQIYLQTFVIYILGNFWIKLLGLIFLFQNLRIKNIFYQFLSLSLFISIALSIIVVPNPDPFNAVQFGQIAVLISGILFCLWLKNIKHGQTLALVLFPVMIFIFAKDFFTPNRFQEYIVPSDEVEALQYIKKQTPKESVFMVDPLFNNAKMKVSGLGERRTFYTGGKIPWLLGIDSDGRRLTQEKYLLASDFDFVQDTNSMFGINYIYTTPNNPLTKVYSPVFKNSNVVILETGVKPKTKL